MTSGRLQHLGEMLCVASLLLNDMCDLKMGPIMQDDMITFTIQDFKIMVTYFYDVKVNSTKAKNAWVCRAFDNIFTFL